MKQPPPPVSPEQAFELPRRIQGNQELLDLFTRNNSLLIRFVCSDNVHQPDLEVLAQMKMNQMKVDSIAAQQNQMVDYLLSRGVERYSNGHAPAVEAHPAHTVAAPLALPAAAAGKTKTPNGVRSQTVIEYARAHGGNLRLSQFRADYLPHDRKFATTGVYPVTHSLFKAGLLERVGEGVYRLTESAAQPQDTPKRGRPLKHKKEAEPLPDDTREGTPFARGKAAMLDWAHTHNGEIVLTEFWPEYEKAGGDRKFRKAQYVAAENFVRSGVFEKLGGGHFRLNTPPAEAPAADDQPQPATAAETGEGLPLWTGGGGKNVIVYWAAHHDGVFSVRAFRPWWEASASGSPTFARTTVFTALHDMAEDGLAKKTGPGEYKIHVAKARKAMGLE